MKGERLFQRKTGALILQLRGLVNDFATNDLNFFAELLKRVAVEFLRSWETEGLGRFV